MKQLEDDNTGRDRVIEIETDDEDNVAERVCQNHENDTESDASGPAPDPSFSFADPDNINSWPLSYRQSIDMYTSVASPTLSFLQGTSFMASFDKKSQTESSLDKPLIPESSLDKDFFPTSTLPVKISSNSGLRFSSTELPQHQQCSYSQTVLNAINALCGIGILSTPYALREGGWFSLSLLFVYGIITCYTGVLLKRCLESSSNLKTYPDIGQAAFGFSGRIFIAAILYMELYSSCVEFLIMMSDNLSSFFPNAQVEFAGIHLNSYQICAIIATLVVLPTVWLRNLSLLSYVSVGGVLSLVVVVVCLLWVGVAGGVGFHPTGKTFELGNLPITIGIYSFCYGSHSVFPNIYSSMQEPSEFPSVLAISFTLAALLYAGVAVFGFLMFGEDTNPQITLNLPTGLVSSNIAGWSVVIAPVTKFALSLTPVALSIEELLPPNLQRSHGISILIRTGLTVSTLVVALTVPYFGSVMAFIGSFLVMLVSIILPCVCYMRIGRGTLSMGQIAACTFVIVVGVFSAITGTYSAVKRMSD